MTPAQIEALFWQHADAVTHLEQADADVPDLEPELLALVQWVRAQASHQPLFIRLFIEAATDRRTSAWVVLYCMRVLRWPQVRDAINEWFAAQGGRQGAPRLMNFVSDVNKAYDDANWEDREFFRHCP